MTDPVPYLTEKIPPDQNPERDAIHIALIPMIAGEDHMYPGDKIKLAHGTNDTVVQIADEREIIGIVNPFMNSTARIMKGDKIWIWLTPNSITGMKHHWQHPLIDNPNPTNEHESETWLKRFCEEWNFHYPSVRETIDGLAPTEPSQDESIDQLNTNAPLPDEDEFRETFADDYITAQGKDLHSKEELGEDYNLFWHHVGILNERTYTTEDKDKVGWGCSC